MKVKDATLEDLKQYKKQGRSKKDTDLISTRRAYKLRGEGRVKELISRGLLCRTSSGRAKNSAKYVSKKRLFELDNTYI